MIFKRNTSSKSSASPLGAPIYIFVLSYNRPIYLWCMLDSLYRNTPRSAKIVIADNASTDPLIKEVIEGFERRGLFFEVNLCPDNRPDRLQWMIERHRQNIGEFFAFVESDVVILDPDWTDTMLDLMSANPKLYMLGSRCDTQDFIDPVYAREIEPEMDPAQFEFLIKAHSPERNPIDTRLDLIEPHNPPGRLVMFRQDILNKVSLATDAEIYKSLKAIGLEAKITTRVRHRHLSLLNFYDYVDYDAKQRANFFATLDSASRPTG